MLLSECYSGDKTVTDCWNKTEEAQLATGEALHMHHEAFSVRFKKSTVTEAINVLPIQEVFLSRCDAAWPFLSKRSSDCTVLPTAM